jgi:predicted nucleic acid-binding protein
MELVVDTAILFSFFNERSRARQISISGEVVLHSPVFAVRELKEHKSRILEDFSLSESQFEIVMKLLETVVRFVPEEEYSQLFSRAKEISPDPDDVDFFALALKFDCAIWSNDERLRAQSVVEVLATEDVVKLLGF